MYEIQANVCSGEIRLATYCDADPILKLKVQLLNVADEKLSPFIWLFCANAWSMGSGDGAV